MVPYTVHDASNALPADHQKPRKCVVTTTPPLILKKMKIKGEGE